MRVLLIILLFLLSNLIHVNTSYALEWEVKNNSNTKIEAIKTTPWGIVAGEYDNRLWINPYNGIYISKDLGNTWNKYGLAGRGVTDIEYFGENIYASTYFFVNNTVGIFMSEDAGNTWIHLGENFSTANISAYENIILQGTYSQGLWISKDTGVTWQPVLVEALGQTQILETKAGKDLLMATTANSVFVSRDKGETWAQVNTLKNKRIKHIEIASNIILANSETMGMYRSTDSGVNWVKVEGWESNISGPIVYFEKVFYSSGLDNNTNKYNVYESKDFGQTWQQTNLNPKFNDSRVLGLTPIFTHPHFILASVLNEGLFTSDIDAKEIKSEPFLEIPWQISQNEELIEKIYSYFDHEYPLINNRNFQEPAEFKDSILSFLGKRKSNFEMNYSGHDGYDFSLNLGTPILSAFEGIAKYHWSETTGHTITIAHPNGYKTLYGHLQDTGLITTLEDVNVTSNQVIGYVGTSGRTTGPHLHFSVEKVLPTDPFGWQADFDDPWQSFIWEDSIGVNTGVESKYLWNRFPPKEIKYVDANGGEILLNNKKIIIDQNANSQSFTIFVEPYDFPKVPVQQNKLVYITGTSMLVNMFNIVGKKPPLLLKPVKIEMDVSTANLEQVWENTMKFYFWNSETRIWEELDSIFDVATKRLTGETYHFSHIAAFAQKREGFFDRVEVKQATFKIK